MFDKARVNVDVEISMEIMLIALDQMILYLCLWGGGGMLGEVAESTQLNSSGSGPNRKKNCLEQASNK